MDTNEWLNKAKESLDSRGENGRAFELKDLFVGEEWQQLTRGERSTFGRAFAEAVSEGKFKNVEKTTIGNNGRHNRYRKTASYE